MVASTREAILIGRTGGGAILPTTTIVVHSVEDLRPQAGSELMSQTAGLGLGQAKGGLVTRRGRSLGSGFTVEFHLQQYPYHGDDAAAGMCGALKQVV